uniref:Uncharacterized protein n=1 Tax=Octactis speculum TaxID=3111310 RepID=A0A6U3T5A7_9STRA
MAGKSTMRFSASKNRLRRRAGTFGNAGLQTMQEKYSQGQVRHHTSTKNCRNHGWYLDFADLPAVACIKNLSPLTSREVLEDRSLHDAEKYSWGEVTLYTSTKNCLISLRYRKSTRYNGNS